MSLLIISILLFHVSICAASFKGAKDGKEEEKFDERSTSWTS
jgi:hypothetical protein